MLQVQLISANMGMNQREPEVQSWRVSNVKVKKGRVDTGWLHLGMVVFKVYFNGLVQCVSVRGSHTKRVHAAI